MKHVLSAEVIVGGTASGPLLILKEPVSFWGGIDEATGRIIDHHHPQYGENVTGTALFMTATRGSSSSSSTFLECVRFRTAPAILLLTERDAILPVAAAAAWEIYDRGPTVVIVDEDVDLTSATSIAINGHTVYTVGPRPGS